MQLESEEKTQSIFKKPFFTKRLFKRKWATILTLVIIAVVLPLTVYLSLRQQELRQHASATQTNIYFADPATEAPITALSLAPGEEKKVGIYINTNSNYINGFDIIFSYPADDSFSHVDLAPGTYVTKFNTVLYQDTVNAHFAAVDTTVPPLTTITGAVQIATIDMVGGTAGKSGSFRVTSAMVIAPVSSVPLSVDTPTLPYTIGSISSPTLSPTLPPGVSPTSTPMPTPGGSSPTPPTTNKNLNTYLSQWELLSDGVSTQTRQYSLDTTTSGLNGVHSISSSTWTSYNLKKDPKLPSNATYVSLGQFAYQQNGQPWIYQQLVQDSGVVWARQCPVDSTNGINFTACNTPWTINAVSWTGTNNKNISEYAYTYNGTTYLKQIILLKDNITFQERTSDCNFHADGSLDCSSRPFVNSTHIASGVAGLPGGTTWSHIASYNHIVNNKQYVMMQAVDTSGNTWYRDCSIEGDPHGMCTDIFQKFSAPPLTGVTQLSEVTYNSINPSH